MSRRRAIAIALGCLVVAIAMGASHPRQGHAATSAGKSCGAYTEGGEYDGSEDRRVVVSPQGIGCDRGAVVVRSFRSLLPKHRLGAANWWSLSSPAGWRCQKSATGGSCRRGQASVGYTVEDFRPDRRCTNGITIDHGVAGVIILSWRSVGCGLRHALAHGVTRSSASHGFSCHRLDLRAGGGGALCRRGSRFIELGFE